MVMVALDEEGASPVDSDGEESTAPSLCDLPMMDPDGPHGQRRSPPPSDLFEFFFDGLSAADDDEMCTADDIFLRGQLLPYKPPPSLPSPVASSNNPDPKAHPIRYRRSESLDGPRGQGGLAAEYRRLRRAASDSAPPAPLVRAAARPRPRWYLFMFGSVRVPAAMEMKDIRSRQRRRSPSPVAATEPPGAWGCEAGRGPWRLLRSLSCKGLESSVVTAPLSLVSDLNTLGSRL